MEAHPGYRIVLRRDPAAVLVHDGLHHGEPENFVPSPTGFVV